MASQLVALTSITSSLAKAYFFTGRVYHNLDSPVPGLRNEFTVSPFRELPDLITIFGMLEKKLVCARMAMEGGHEYLMIISLCVANALVTEAWLRLCWLDQVLANGYRNGGDGDWYEYGDDSSGEAFEKWRAVLPDCCGASAGVEEMQEQQEEPDCRVAAWVDAVAAS